MFELLFSINHDSPTPMYHQIYQYLRTQILSGKIAKNTKLPSVRRLAEQLNVSRNTTQVAYEQLQSEGYIRSENKKGYYVEAMIPDDLLAFDTKKQSVSGEPLKKPELIDFKLGTVDEANFPFKKWRMLTNKVMKDPDMYSYGDKQGDRWLRMELEDYLFQSRGVKTSADQIIIGGSTQQLLVLASLLLRDTVQSIAVEDPGYDVARELFSLMSFSVHPIPVTEDDGMMIDPLLLADTRLVYVTPTHHFPFGGTIPVSQRVQLLQWANEVNGYIIEDDYDSEFRYIHHPVPSLQSIDSSQRVIYMGTFSKALLPTIRVSYMALPENLMMEYRKNMAVFEQTASAIHQRTLAFFMSEGHWYPHLRKMKAIYKRKMNLLINELTKHFGDVITIKGGHSGLFIIMEVKIDVSEEQLLVDAYEGGVVLYPCSRYYVNEQPVYPHVQIGLGNLSEEEIVGGVSLLASAWL
ncbi:PLP-dependent aminotransferase family protein [Rossellomorea sp. YZS02]|uniref:MocR-like pyridoxine biosynthesis transcription factor PdxR n=1 Tax=Rossellomorea sp. YZS02 TaxID=3097358 RepID=UPI002A0AF846|nr:PLP-dependent aminotransferase family protein [Rossellomorea sp. YZS02]MDX8342220.1 PLP-dependent aminotransferase family protein [Rossellomorea sp. YZS02]